MSDDKAIVRKRALPTLQGAVLRANAYLCWNCERPFEPVAHRWLCPHCKAKNDCCSGE